MASKTYTIRLDDADFRKKLDDLTRLSQKANRAMSSAFDMKAPRTELQKLTQEIGSVHSALGSLGKGLGAYFSWRGVKEFVGELVNVRGMIQQLEIAFNTLTGSQEKSAKLMSQLTATAARTPFDLPGIAQGAKQLLAYGTRVEDINEKILMLGDIAAGLSIPLGDLVYLYGTTMTQGRVYTQDMRQFMNRGIPLAEELAKQFGVAKEAVGELVTEGKVGAKEFEAALQNLANTRFHNLMAEQSKSLTGQMSNLKDTFVGMLNEMGKASEGILSKGISGTQWMVENYKEVGRVIAELVATYGVYKTAVLTMTAVQTVATEAAKGYTLAQTIQYRWLLMAEKAQKLLNATILKNPYVIAGAAVAGLALGIYKLVTAQTEAEKAQEKLNDTLAKARGEVQSEKANIDALFGTLKTAKEGTEAYRIAKETIISQYGEYLKGLGDEIESLRDVEGAYNAVTESAIKAAKARAFETGTREAQDTYAEKMVEGQKALEELTDKIMKGADDKGKAFARKMIKGLIDGTVAMNQLPADLRNRINNGSGLFNGSWRDEIGALKYEAREAKTILDSTVKSLTEALAGDGVTNVLGELVVTAETPKTAGGEAESANRKATKEARKSWEEYARETTKAVREAEMQIREASIKAQGDTLEAQIDQIHLDADRRREEIESAKDQWVKSFADFHHKQNATLEDLAPAQQEAYRKLLGIVDREELEAIRKTQDEALKEFYTFSQKRDALIKEWDAKRQNATKAWATAEQLKVLSEAEKEALDDLDGTFARKQDSFKSWLDDLAGAGFKELQSALARARLMLAEAEIDESAEGIAIATEKIKETEAALKGFKAPVPSDRDADKWTDLHKTLTDIGSEFDDIGAKMGGILGGVIGGLGKAVTQAGRLAVSFDKLGKAKTPTEKLTAGIGAVSAAVGVFSSLLDTFKGVQDTLTRQEAEARKFRVQAEALNDTLARTKRVAEEAGKALRIFTGDAYGDARRDVEAFTEAQWALGETIRQTVESATKYKDLDALIRGIGDDMARGKASILDTGDELKNFSQVLANIQVKTGEKGWWLWKHDTTDALGKLLPELFKTDGTLDFDALGDFTKSDLFNQIPEQYQALFKKLEAEHEDYKESLKGVRDYLSSVFGSLGGDLMDGIVSAFRAGEDASKSFAGSVEKTLEKLVSDMIYSQVFSGMLKDAEGDIQELMKAGASQTAYFDYFDRLMGKIEVGGAMAESLLKQARQAGKERGFDLFKGDDAESGGRRTAQTKGLAQASQDSINELNGRATAIQEHTYLISENTKLLLTNTSSILNHVAGIHADTVRLKAIEASTRATEAAITEIRDKGIKLK